MNIYQYIGTFVCLIFLALCATHAPISEKLKSAIWDLTFVAFVTVELIQIINFGISLYWYLKLN